MRAVLLIVIVWSCAVAAGSAAQAPKQPAAPAPAQPPATPAPPPAKSAAPPPEPFTYESGGRRDPFLNLVGTGTEPALTSKRGEGPAGLTVAEISVRGIMQSRGGLVA